MAKLESYFLAGDLKAARLIVQKLLEKNPNNRTALVGLARLEAIDGNLQKSLALLNGVLEKKKSHVPAKTYKAVVLNLMDQPKSSEMLLRSATKRDPDFAPAHYNLARQLLQKGAMDDALEELETAAKLDPDNPTYSLRIAEIFLERGDNTQAAEMLTLLVSAFPQYPAGWLCAARAQMKHGQTKKAMETLANGLSHNPQELSLALAAFQVAAALGDFEFCQQATTVVASFADQFGKLLEIILSISKAPTQEASLKAVDLVPSGLLEETGQFLQSIAISAPPKRAEIMRAAISALETRFEEEEE